MSIYNAPSEDGIYTVTPAQAKFWLENYAHPRNRTWRYKNPEGADRYPSTVKMYRKEMEQGRWKVTNASIGFSRAGFLIDGHNRLMACVLSGVPLKTRVAVNVPDESFDVIDIGKTRTANNLLTPDFGQASSLVVSTVRLQVCFADGGKSAVVRPDRIYEYVSPGGQYERIGSICTELYDEVRRTKVKIPILLHVIAFMRFNTERYGQISDEWCRAAMYGTGFDPDHPVIVFRNQAISHMMANNGKLMKRAQASVFAIRSWNLMAENKPAPSRYVYRDHGAARVTFPAFKEPK